ncbi:MAG: membrane-bound PQQ-dependent dehydrogenase, glucose/quinate/shikimate family, partial [Pseudomonadota bacterium]
MKRPLAFITAAGLALIGLFLALLGARLALLGGSLFYVLFGVGLIATGVLVWKNHAATLHLFAALLAATLAWAVWETGLEFWGLEVRLLMPVVMGFWLLLTVRRSRLFLLLTVSAALLLLAVSYGTRDRYQVRQTLQ